jgi:DNA-binding HxlR family transcriptional regulator
MSEEFQFDKNLVKLIQGLGQHKNRLIILEGIINIGKDEVTMKELQENTNYNITEIHKQLQELVSSGIVTRAGMDEKDPTRYTISPLGRKLLQALNTVI